MTVLDTVDTIDPEILENRIAILATLGPGGDPQMTAVWFLVEGDTIIVSAMARRKKTKNLATDGRCSMLIFHPDSDDYYVEIRGAAEVTDDSDYAAADRIAVRYDSDFRNFDGPDDTRVLITLRPERIIVTDVRD